MINNNKKKLENIEFNWFSKKAWIQSSKNTLWCLLGCSIGDFGTIIFFQYNNFLISTFLIMMLAIINGLITSLILETIVLLKQMDFKRAFNTALGMSFISMVAMEISMNAVDLIIIGKPVITWWIVPIMLFFGFITALPYNYWRLLKYQLSCH